MIQQVDFNQFVDAFKNMNRDNFTHQGYSVLFEYFETLEADCDMTIDFDVIAICCDYSEYTESQLTNDFGLDQTFKNMSEELSEHVIGWTDNTVIIRSF